MSSIQKRIERAMRNKRFKLMVAWQGGWATILEDLTTEEADGALAQYKEYFDGERFTLEPCSRRLP